MIKISEKIKNASHTALKCMLEVITNKNYDDSRKLSEINNIITNWCILGIKEEIRK